MFIFVVSSINKTLIITKVFIKFLLLVRRKSRKLFQRRRNEKSLRITGVQCTRINNGCLFRIDFMKNRDFLPSHDHRAGKAFVALWWKPNSYKAVCGFTASPCLELTSIYTSNSLTVANCCTHDIRDFRLPWSLQLFRRLSLVFICCSVAAHDLHAFDIDVYSQFPSRLKYGISFKIICELFPRTMHYKVYAKMLIFRPAACKIWRLNL